MRLIERKIPRVGTVLLCAALLWPAQPALAQFTQDGPKLVGSGAVGGAEQGQSVALSADGHTSIVGGNLDNSGAGAVWVFTRSGGVWSQQGAKLVGTGAVGAANQGISVALSADGNTAIAGGFNDNSGAGAAWVFTRSGGVWNQQGAKLVGTGATQPARQGQSVALSSDGNTAILGGVGDDANTGRAWVFTRSGGVWSQQGNKLFGTGVVGGAEEGHAVALSGDGNTAMVGGPFDNSNAGAAWVFTLNGDGMTDILWYNTSTGQAVIWLLNATTVIGGGSPGSAPSPWTIAATGDFDGDGLTDVLWYNTNKGQTVIWLINGTTLAVKGGGSPGSVSSPWTIAETGDFNGDSKSDILWYNSTSGQLVVWLLNSTSVIGGGSPGSAPSPWLIQGMNAD